MIYDRLENLKDYKGLSAGLDTAIDYLAANGVETLGQGKYAIDGDRVFFLVQSYETKDLSAAKYEAHRKYIDIQFVLEGAESCFCSPLAGLVPSEPFIAERDIGFYQAPEAEAFLPLTPGVFALFFPRDAHKPSCDLGEKRAVRKIVVKVAV